VRLAGDQTFEYRLARRALTVAAPYLQADTESQFSSKSQLEPDPKANMA
jgi:hypothetical protein